MESPLDGLKLVEATVDRATVSLARWQCKTLLMAIARCQVAASASVSLAENDGSFMSFSTPYPVTRSPQPDAMLDGSTSKSCGAIPFNITDPLKMHHVREHDLL